MSPPRARPESSRPAVDAERLLEIENLAVAFPSRDGPVYGVERVTMNLARRERLAVVGESGSGKSVTALAVLGLVQAPGRIMRGRITWRGRDMRDPAVARSVRGREISMIFQDPMTSLNPVVTIGEQIREVLERRLGMSRAQSPPAGHRHARHGRHPVPEGAAQAVPARAVRRHAAAGDDRHRARVRTDAADRRRADDGARRHHPGADPRAAAAPVGGARAWRC